MPPVSPDSPVGRASGPTARPASRPATRPASHRASRCRNCRHRTSLPPPPTPDALEALIADLGARIQARPATRGSGGARLRRATTRQAAETATLARFHPTGLPDLDAGLGGGFPAGRLCEICGQQDGGLSAGRTALALALLAEPLGRGALAAWIDLADAFDPRAAEQTLGAHWAPPDALERLLWVRARDEDEALRCCERVLRTEGFELVVFDPFRPALAERRRERPRVRVRDVTWLRLARLATGTRTTLVALSQTPSTGARAELVLELRPRGAFFGPPPGLLESVEVEAVLRRHRSRPTGLSWPLCLDTGGRDAGAPGLDGRDASGAAPCA